MPVLPNFYQFYSWFGFCILALDCVQPIINFNHIQLLIDEPVRGVFYLAELKDRVHGETTAVKLHLDYVL